MTHHFDTTPIDDDRLPQEVEDAVVTSLGRRLALIGRLDAVLADMAPEERRLVEQAWDRHAHRRRADGEAGW